MKSTHILFTGTLILLTFFCSCDRFKKPQADAEQLSLLRISSDEPLTLDPRQVRDLLSTTFIYTLYEGLMRYDEKGHPQPAIAESVNISPDQTLYTFKLHPSYWSNGERLTARDFEESWKTILNPRTAAPNAYQFYVIKGAQAAKEGRLPLDHIGLHAIDDDTLLVQLEQPAPYFLNLLATYFFYPVHRELREGNKGNSDYQTTLISNGPFKLEKWNHHHELTVIKNPYYWDSSHVYLNQILFVDVEPTIALQMFGRNELDWIGSPLSTIPADALVTLKTKGDLRVKPAAGTYWFRFNTQKGPFDQTKIRQAFSLALNRQELIDHVLQGNQIAAMGITPPCLMKNDPFYKDHDVAQAQEIFETALRERGISRHDLMPITLCYATNERNHKVAQVVQQQWKEALDVKVVLQACESKLHYDTLKNNEHQIALGSWFADVADPISFLEVFKFRDNGTNNTQWENVDYIQTLNASSRTADVKARKELLKHAESILMAEMPISPFFIPPIAI